MSDLVRTVVIILAVIGAIGVVAAIWEEVGPRIRREKTEELDFDDDFEANDVRSAAAQLELEHTWWEMSLEALEAEPAFQLAVSALADADTDVDEVVTLSRDADGWVASMGLAALAQRDDVPDDWLSWAARNPVRPSVCEDRLLLRALAVHSGQPVIGAGLLALESLRDEVVAEFVGERISRGEQVDVDTFDKLSLETAENLEAFIDRFEVDLGPDFRPSFETWRALANLKNIGRIWERPFDDPPTLLAGRRRELVEIVVAALEQSPPRSVLLVGEHGVGKTALTRAALDRIDEDAIVFETTAAQINAGAIYIGELEGRVKTLVDAVAGQRVIWILPELQETLFAGQHSRSPQGLLDALLPHIESGAIAIVAEVTPAAAEVLVAARARVKSAFEVVRVRPLDDPDTVAVARHALEHDALGVDADDETLAEALELAQQFLPSVAQPGNLLRLAHATAAEAAEQGAAMFDGRDVLTTLAASSGLPLALLDAAAPLPLDAVKAFFTERVLEQPEAVDCIVERIAMIKAGVTDPRGPSACSSSSVRPAREDRDREDPRRVPVRFRRPADPSGHERVPVTRGVRSSPLRYDRGGTRLGADLVRPQGPFAVVLLDEFEKAAQPVLDLFLQVFDDGRLTDLQGRVVDFRRSVIVLTSNIGSPLAQGSRVGFDPADRTSRTRVSNAPFKPRSARARKPLRSSRGLPTRSSGRRCERSSTRS